MPSRRIPLRPDLDQLRTQAKDLLRAVRREDSAALEDFREFHPNPPDPTLAKLSDAQLALARSYEAPSWLRLAIACKLIDAIWRDDIAEVRELAVKHPHILHENATIRDSHWGPPLSYAANAGRDKIIKALYELGARDLEKALGRATLQGHVDTARLLHSLLGAPRPPNGVLGGPAYTLSAAGTALLFELGAEMLDENGRTYAPVDVVLESDGRRPIERHRILEMYVEHGFELPDSPMMALHRGRIDLLETHVERDATLLTRTFSHSEIFPPSLGCQSTEDLPRTTLHGATLLHVCVEFDELDIARWLLGRGMSPDAPAAVDGEGFGGHTALFGAVVSYPNFWMNYTGGWAHSKKPLAAALAELLLEHGADPNARASLRERIWGPVGVSTTEHRHLTPLSWGEVFHNKMIVSAPAMEAVARRGGLSSLQP